MLVYSSALGKRKMLSFSTIYQVALLIVFQVALNKGASVSSFSKSEEQNEHLSSNECSFLSETMTDQCSDFWGGKQAPLILISLDGFRPEYLSRIGLAENNQNHKEQDLAAPTLNCLSKQGVFSTFMMPSYPTITFPNHYSIVTGLYPESHGIIANQFYDPDLKAQFSIRNKDATDPKWWSNGEPIWTTVRKQGKISATYFWPGSDVNFTDQRTPNYFFKYNKTTSFRERVDQVLDWINLPVDKRPALTTLYFEEPDGIGHKEGPNTVNVTEKVTLVDQHIRRLIDGLTDRNISNCVNIIIVSDHGMADSPPGQLLVDLAKYVPDLQESTVTFYGPVPSIRPKNDTKKEKDRIGHALACKNPHMRVFNKWELPYRMHSTQSRRIPELVLDMDVSWRAVFQNDSYSGKGAHGWDNLFPDMHAIFMAIGPSFKSRAVVQPFENVQLYNLFCALVNVTPAVNNGTWGALHHLLIDPPNLGSDENKELPEMPQILRTVSESQTKKRTACGLLNSRESKDINFEIDITMDMTEERESELLLEYAPLGIPVDYMNELSSLNASNYVLLVNEDYVTGFDVELGVPLWAAYTVAGEETNSTKDGIWIEDLRLDPNHTGSCLRLSSIQKKGDVIYTHLFPREFAKHTGDVWLDTNLLEVPSGMSTVIETMIQMLNEAAAIHGPLNVVSGPTRHHSPAVFYVITTCKLNSSTDGNWNLTTCPVEYRDLQSFILPIQSLKYQNCISERDFIAFNVATLKDVEDVTDFIFFPDLPTEDKLNLMTKTTLDSKLLVDPTRRNK